MRSFYRKAFWGWVMVFLLCAAPVMGQTNVDSQWSASEVAESFAEDLLQARTIPAVEAILLELLELLDIGVFARDGRVVVPSTSVLSEDDFYLYDFQVRLLAEQFVEQRYQPLQDIMALWQQAGIMIIPPGQNQYVPIDAVLVEKEMRSLRRWAEEFPDEREGFIIRLVDALGDRATAPFDLLQDLADDEYEAPTSGAPSQQMQDRLRDALDTALEGEDLGEEFNADALFAAMLSGDLSAIVEAAAGAEAAAEMKEGLAEARTELARPPDASDDPMAAELQALQASALNLISAVFDGDTDAQELLRLAMEQHAKQSSILAAYHQQVRSEWEANAAERERELAQGNPDAADFAASAWAAFVGVPAVLDSEWGWQQTEVSTERFEAELELAEAEREWQERRMASYPSDEEDPPRSTLVLDPIQSLLLQLDILVPPHDPADLAGRRAEVSLRPRLLLVQERGNRNLGSELLGVLNDRLQSAMQGELTSLVTDAAGEGFQRLKKRLDIPGKVLDILHGAMIMMAHTTTVEVNYYPDDAASGEGIRLRSSAERSAEARQERRIEVTVTVTFDPPAAAQAVEWGRMRMAQFTRYTIPGTAPWLMGNLALDKLSDLEFPEAGPREDIAVQLRYGADLRRYVVLDVEEWFQPALMLVVTDENGQAVVNFYLEEENEPAATWGGRPYWAFGEDGATIRVHPLTESQENGAWSYQEVAFGVADWLQGVTGIGAVDVPIHIERLAYVPWEGTVSLQRMVVVSVDADVESPRRGEGFGIRTVLYHSLDDWLLKADSPELLLSATEASPNPSSAEHSGLLWDVSLGGSHTFQEHQEYWSQCRLENHTECLTERRADFKGTAEADMVDGTLTARPTIRLEAAAGRYKVNLLMMPVAASGILRPIRVSDVIIDCEGEHADADRERELERVHSTFRPEIAVLLRTGLHDFPSVYDERWSEFSRDMETLSGSLRWPSPIPNVSFTYRARPTVHVHNILEWNFRRDLSPRE